MASLITSNLITTINHCWWMVWWLWWSFMLYDYDLFEKLYESWDLMMWWWYKWIDEVVSDLW